VTTEAPRRLGQFQRDRLGHESSLRKLLGLGRYVVDWKQKDSSAREARGKVVKEGKEEKRVLCVNDASI
jgi:hypothetical protein